MIQSEYKPFKVILSATNKLVDMCKPTFGPAGNKVILADEMNSEALDDGVSIVKRMQLEDPMENAIVDLIKQVAIKTNSRVGDGTTGSLIILQAILKEVEALGKVDTRKVSEELKKAALEAKNSLTAQAKKIKTVEDLEKVARISFDNPKIAKVIAEIIHKIGPEGVVYVQDSNTMEVEHETVEGFDFEKGYISPYMVTNKERSEADLDKPVIFLTDYRLSINAEFLPIWEQILKAGHKNILVVADDVSGDVLSTAVVNQNQGRFNTLCVQTPGYDTEKSDFLEDLATVTGATIISQNKGMKLEDFTLEMLGNADKVISRQNQTIVIGGKGKKQFIKSRAGSIKLQLDDVVGLKQERMQRRYARLNNGIAIIKVGAATPHEAQALRYKVEDAVNATKVAFSGGIVAGGGNALADIVTSSQILNKALEKPSLQLMENSGLVPVMHLGKVRNIINIITREEGDYMKVGVSDPVAVLIAQIESAVSIACLLITTTGLIVDVKDKA